MRKGKSEAEADLLRKAVGVTADAHREVARLIRPGIPEYRLEGAILGAFVSGGATRAGFPSIVGSGPNSTVLHYSKNDRTIEDGDLVVVDIGGEYRGYTADITRTYPASGKFTPRQREVYQLVLDAQTAAVAEFKPGNRTIAGLTQVVWEVFRKSPLRARDARRHGADDGPLLRPRPRASPRARRPRRRRHLEAAPARRGLHDRARPLHPRRIPGCPDRGRLSGDQGGLEKLSKDIPVEVDEIERLIAEARADVNRGAAEITSRFDG